MSLKCSKVIELPGKCQLLISTDKFLMFMVQMQYAKERHRNGSENLRRAVKMTMTNLAQADHQLDNLVSADDA